LQQFKSKSLFGEKEKLGYVTEKDKKIRSSRIGSGNIRRDLIERVFLKIALAAGTRWPI